MRAALGQAGEGGVEDALVVEEVGEEARGEADEHAGVDVAEVVRVVGRAGDGARTTGARQRKERAKLPARGRANTLVRPSR